MSSRTAACLACHNRVSPGIVGDWRDSRHARTTPAEALKKGANERRMSAAKAPAEMAATSVGCAECHVRPDGGHKDAFDHFGHKVHVVVTPKDCATCHPVEADEYGDNLMAEAYPNLMHNPVYKSLVDAINGVQTVEGATATLQPADDDAHADSCLQCHGTVVKLEKLEPKKTSMGTFPLPVLTGWPNQGVGRMNPDGSKGACTACHARHAFSIEVARKPDTCSQCHKGPDVPAYAVYKVSKHGNIYASSNKDWKMTPVPWVVGEHFNAPTCATCHVSMLATPDGTIVAKRTHRMNDRSAWRLFGVPYAHPHPKSADVTKIRNKAGLPLPTELTGEPAASFLIDGDEQKKRHEAMNAVCLACHGRAWVEGWQARLEKTIDSSNRMTLASTKLLLEAWKRGAAKGLADKDGIFNEPVEKMWVEQWLFHANSARFASAMAGADYGVFASGRWHMSKNVQELVEWLKVHAGAGK